jgi:DHA1 family bicyclomycin/chloramphenicol resistance-like MFS transporter
VAGLAREQDASRVRGHFDPLRNAVCPPHPTRRRKCFGGATLSRAEGKLSPRSGEKDIPAQPCPMDAKDPDALSRAATPWRLLGLLMAMTAIGPATLNIVVPALPHLTALLAADTGTVQLVLSLYLLSFAVAQLLLGPLSDRFGRRPVALAGLTLNVVASFAAIASASIETLIVARVVQAFGASTGMVIGRAIIRDLYERDRAAAMIGLVTTAMVVAPMVTPLVGGILDTTFGWQSIFLFIALMSSAVLLWAVPELPETRGPRAPQAPALMWRDWHALLGNGKFHGYVLAAALGSAPFFTFLGGGPYVVVTQMGHSSADFGLWFVFSSLGFMSGNFTVSRLSWRFGIDGMIIAGIICLVVGSALAIVLTDRAQWGLATVFVPLLIISYGNGLALPTGVAGAVSVRPQAAGSASGITGFVQMAVAAAATQTVMLALAGAADAMPMNWMMLVESVVLGVAFWLLVKRR